MSKGQEKKVTKGELHKALNEVIRGISQEELAAGCTIKVLPAEEEGQVTIQVNWNS